MTEKKDFDCVDMKWEIQRKLEEKYKGMPEEDARRLQWKQALADPIMGPFLSKVLSRQKRNLPE